MVKDSISADLKGLGPLGMEFKTKPWDCSIAACQTLKGWTEVEYLRLKDLLPGIYNVFVLQIYTVADLQVLLFSFRTVMSFLPTSIHKTCRFVSAQSAAGSPVHVLAIYWACLYSFLLIFFQTCINPSVLGKCSLNRSHCFLSPFGTNTDTT